MLLQVLLVTGETGCGKSTQVSGGLKGAWLRCTSFYIHADMPPTEQHLHSFTHILSPVPSSLSLALLLLVCDPQVPQFIMEAAEAAGQLHNTKIVAAQPRRLITTGDDAQQKQRGLQGLASCLCSLGLLMQRQAHHHHGQAYHPMRRPPSYRVLQ